MRRCGGSVSFCAAWPAAPASWPVWWWPPGWPCSITALRCGWPALDVAALEADRDTDDDAQPWASVSTLVDGSADLLGRYPQPQLQQFQQAYRQAAAAYRDHGNPQRPERFAAAMQALAASLRELGEAIEPIRNRLPIRERDDALMATTAYPSPGSTAAEVFYNRLDPFFWSWAISLGAVLLLAVSFAGMRKLAFWAGMLLLLAAQTLIVVGFALRMDITGWAPVTNMFETIVFVAVGRAAGNVVHLVAAAEGPPGRRGSKSTPANRWSWSAPWWRWWRRFWPIMPRPFPKTSAP